MAFFTHIYHFFAHVHPSQKLHPGLGQNLVLLLVLPTLLVAYRFGFKDLKNRSLKGTRNFVLPAIVASTFCLCTPIFNSTDVLSYTSPGWQQLHYHINPYVITTAKTPGFGTDPLLTSNPWALNPIPYGFAFAHLARIICQLGHGNLDLTANLFKVLTWIVYLLLGFAIYRGAKLLKLARPDLCLYLYMWNPLILLEAVANGHNDIVMTFPVVLAFLCATSQFSLLALSLFTVGVLVKYVWILALPFLLLFLAAKHGWKHTLSGAALAGVTAALISWRYLKDWQDIRWFDLALNLQNIRGSFHRTVRDSLYLVNKFILHGTSNGWCDGAMNVVQLSIVLAFVALTMLCIWKALKARRSFTISSAIEMSILAMISWICVVTIKFFGWYVIMFVPAALLLPEGNEVRRLAIILSCTQLFSLTFLNQCTIADYVLMTGIPIIISLRRWQRNAKITSTNPIARPPELGLHHDADTQLISSPLPPMADAAN
jgi:hypothetical protein